MRVFFPLEQSKLTVCNNDVSILWGFHCTSDELVNQNSDLDQ